MNRTNNFNDPAYRQDVAEALYDITMTAALLQQQGRIHETDSRDMMRFCGSLAVNFVDDERSTIGRLTALLGQCESIASDDLVCHNPRLSGAVEELIGAFHSDIADFRDTYLDRIETYATEKLLGEYGKEN